MLSGQLCRCTGYAPIVDAIAEVAAAREPRAQPPLRGRAHTRCGGARGRARAADVRAAARARGAHRGRARGPRRKRRGDRVACVLPNEPETVELYWGCQWLGAVRRAALAPDLGGRSLVLHRRQRAPRSFSANPPRSTSSFRRMTSTRVPSISSTSGSPSIQLYTSGTTGRPKGVPRSHRAERAGGLSQAAAARPPPAPSDPRSHAALPHDGHPLLACGGGRRGLLRRPAVVGARTGSRAHRDRADRPRSTSHQRSTTTWCTTSTSQSADVLVRPRGRVCGRSDDERAGGEGPRSRSSRRSS